MNYWLLASDAHDWEGLGYLVGVAVDRARRSGFSENRSKIVPVERNSIIADFGPNGGGQKVIHTARSVGNCQNCKQYRHLAAHHIKPLWAFALEFVLSRVVLTKHSRAINSWDSQFWADLKHFDFSLWHVGNLRALCKECHNADEMNATRVWKGHFKNTATNIVIGDLAMVRKALQKRQAADAP